MGPLLGNNEACVTLTHLLWIKIPLPLEQTNKQTHTHRVDKGLQLYVQ